MPISHEEAYKRGMISSQALSKLQGGGKSTISTRQGPGTKRGMTKFNNKSKVDEGLGHDGPEATGEDQIDSHATQKTARVAGQTIGKVSRGGAVNRGGSVRADAIDQYAHPKNPREGSTVRKGKKHIGVRGGGDTNGGASRENYYGGGNNNRHG